MKWAIEIADKFEPEFDALNEDVQTGILALSIVLELFGPQWVGPALTRSTARTTQT